VSADCEVAHCWYFSNEHASLVSEEYDGCMAAFDGNIDGVNYKIFVSPGTKLTNSNFGSYNLTCDNGAGGSSYNFYTQNIYSMPENTLIQSKTNVNNSDVPAGAGGSLCKLEGGCYFKTSYNAGKGINSSIQYVFNENGGHKYELIQTVKPVAHNSGVINAFGDLGAHNYPETVKGGDSNTRNIYVGLPSLIVIGPSDINSGFFEKFGTYEKNVTFTLLNKSPLDINLEYYNIVCSPGSTCEIDRNYFGWPVDKFNGKQIIRGKITIDKNKLPFTGQVYLDVNYSAVGISGSDCALFNKNKVSSKASNFSYGLLDYQKIQIGLNSDIDFNGCIGENGMIGQTGPSFAPRINIGFGGSVDSESKLVSMDECDSEDLNKINNPDWVYCSKKELLIELAAKIDAAWKIQETIFDANDDLIDDLEKTKGKYLSFNVNIRKQDFSEQSISRGIDSFNLLTLTGATGLEGIATGRNDQVKALINLFSKAKFTYSEGIQTEGYSGVLGAGTYPVNIIIEETDTLTSPKLFDSNFELNPNLSITINFGPKKYAPTVNWFFYDYSDEDFNSLTSIPTTEHNFLNTNILFRGELLSFTQNYNKPEFEIGDYAFSPSYAVPLLVRLKTDSSGDMNKEFYANLQSTQNFEQFSYWTGFASSIDNGCTNITTDSLNPDEESPKLPYRESDSKDGENFYFAQFDENLVPNSTIYLQTILFWPNIPGTTTVNLTNTPNLFYTKNADNNSGSILISQKDSTFSVNTIEELFSAINEEKVCVHQGISQGGTKWTLFWNTKSIYDSIQQRKTSILTNNSDANLCTIREILGS